MFIIWILNREWDAQRATCEPRYSIDWWVIEGVDANENGEWWIKVVKDYKWRWKALENYIDQRNHPEMWSV